MRVCAHPSVPAEPSLQAAAAAAAAADTEAVLSQPAWSNNKLECKALLISFVWHSAHRDSSIMRVAYMSAISNTACG